MQFAFKLYDIVFAESKCRSAAEAAPTQNLKAGRSCAAAQFGQVVGAAYFAASALSSPPAGEVSMQTL